MLRAILDYDTWQSTVAGRTYVKLDKNTVIDTVKSKTVINEQPQYIETLLYMCAHLVAEEATGIPTAAGISEQAAALMKLYYPDAHEKLAAVAEMAGDKKLAKRILLI